jgi:hypothetical protein
MPRPVWNSVAKIHLVYAEMFDASLHHKHDRATRTFSIYATSTGTTTLNLHWNAQRGLLYLN